MVGSALKLINGSGPKVDPTGSVALFKSWMVTMVPSNAGEYHFDLPDRVLHCPWHGWEFDITTGKALFGTDKARLITYPVSVEQGQVCIEAKGLGG